jgi:hypothetical protein
MLTPKGLILTGTAALVLAVGVAAWSSDAAADFILDRTFDDPTITSGDVSSADLLGLAVAIDGNYVLVGAPEDDSKGRDVGQAHQFDANTGTLL